MIALFTALTVPAPLSTAARLAGWSAAPPSAQDGPVAPHGFLYYLPGWPRDNQLLSALLTVGVWIVLAALAYWLLFGLLRALVGRTATRLDDIVLRTVRTPLFVAILAYGLLSALAEFNIDGRLAATLNSLYVAILLAATFYLAWRIMKEVILKWLAARVLETENHVDDIFVPLLNTFGPLIFFLAGAVLVLQYLGVNVGVLAASIGAVGLIVGLAFQSSLSNLFSGLYLTLDAPFQENDLIVLPDGKICQVQKIGLRTSRLYNMDNHSQLFVPNNHLTDANIINITKPTVDLKVSTHVKVPASANPQRVQKILYGVVNSQPEILGEPHQKIAALRQRLTEMSAATGAANAPFITALVALQNWGEAGKNETAPLHLQLDTIHKEMGQHLAAAQAALAALPPGPGGAARERLGRVLGAGLDEGAGNETLDSGRMQQITTALTALTAAVPGLASGALASAISTLRVLDGQENQIDAQLEQQAQEHENRLDRLLQEVVAGGAGVAASLHEQGLPKVAARVPVWTRALAVQYAEQAMRESLAGLDNELGALVAWLDELEAGGVTVQERLRVRDLVGQWGGVRTLERRRVAELQRRVQSWLAWKEKPILSAGDFAQVRELWDRRLRLLSRKLRDSRSADEEVLSARLTALRAWLGSIGFLPPLTEWKLPQVQLNSFSDTELDFAVTFYVDDIKREHFTRQSRVANDVLNDIYETFGREAIEGPDSDHPDASAAPKGVSAQAPTGLLG